MPCHCCPILITFVTTENKKYHWILMILHHAFVPFCGWRFLPESKMFWFWKKNKFWWKWIFFLLSSQEVYSVPRSIVDTNVSRRFYNVIKQQQYEQWTHTIPKKNKRMKNKKHQHHKQKWERKNERMEKKREERIHGPYILFYL